MTYRGEMVSKPPSKSYRLGVDLGGTKIAAAILDGSGRIIEHRRVSNPATYDEIIIAVRELCDGLASPEIELGMCIPGSIRAETGAVCNSNCTCLNGKTLRADLTKATGRPVRLANDANCFALSEARDGAGAGSRAVFGVIIGTGVGGGFVIGGELVCGASGNAGEWGHTPLPWASSSEKQSQRCWCGLQNCMEMWVSGPAFERDYAIPELTASEIVARARDGEGAAAETLKRYINRLARGLAVICNFLDPNIIVLGGGMSNTDELYNFLPVEIAPFLFTDRPNVKIVRHRHGDSSGVRGAAWLWPSSHTG
jgi:fructokinase